MTEKGTEHKKNMKLVADELLNLLNTSNKNEDSETMHLLTRMLNNLISKDISKNDLTYSVEVINKFLNGDANFSDITKSFEVALNKKEEQKATEPKLSDTDIENAKQTNKIWQEYLEKQNKSIFEKIKDSTNKFDNTSDIFTDIPDVNIKIHERPSIDMLKDLFLNNIGIDKKEEIKEKVLSPEEQQRIFKFEFDYPKELYNMLVQSGVFDKKTQDNHILNENRENSEIPTEQSFMAKLLKDLYEQRLLDKKDQEKRYENIISDIYGNFGFHIGEKYDNNEKSNFKNNPHWNEKVIKEHYDKVLPSMTLEKSIIDDIMKRFESLERENKEINNRLDKLENKINSNIEYLTKKLRKLLYLLDIDKI